MTDDLDACDDEDADVALQRELELDALAEIATRIACWDLRDADSFPAEWAAAA